MQKDRYIYIYMYRRYINIISLDTCLYLLWSMEGENQELIKELLDYLSSDFPTFQCFHQKTKHRFFGLMLVLLEISFRKETRQCNDQSKIKVTHPPIIFLLSPVKLKVLVTQLCLTLCSPMDYSPPGFSVHGILQTRILEWVSIPFLKGSSPPRDQTQVSCIAGRFLTV